MERRTSNLDPTIPSRECWLESTYLFSATAWRVGLGTNSAMRPSFLTIAPFPSSLPISRYTVLLDSEADLAISLMEPSPRHTVRKTSRSFLVKVITLLSN